MTAATSLSAPIATPPITIGSASAGSAPASAPSTTSAAKNLAPMAPGIMSPSSYAHKERPMADAVIVSTARTPIGRAYRGAFNNTHGAAVGGHVIAHAVKRAGL